MTRQTLQISGMHCASCVATLESGLGKVSGITAAQVNLATARAEVEFDPGAVSLEKIVSVVRDLGYHAEAGEADLFAVLSTEVHRARRQVVVAAVLTIPLVVVSMGPMFGLSIPLLVHPFDGWLQGGLALGVVLLAGRELVVDGIKQLLRGTSTMNSLVAVGVVASLGWSFYRLAIPDEGGHHHYYFESAGVILTFVLLGRFLEALARRQAGDAISGLERLIPTHVTVLINRFPVRIEAGAVQPGMILQIQPGERIAVDGSVESGNPVLDTSTLTGESMPIEAPVGTTVLAGSLNTTVPFRLRASGTLATGYLSQLIRLVSRAQADKPGLQQTADRIASIFVPVVFVLAALTALGWFFFSNDRALLLQSTLAVLIIACPCAMGLATPTAMLVASGRAAREGIVVRSGDLFERAMKTTRIAFDKTGTLTSGHPAVVAIHVERHSTEADLLQKAASLEQVSEHPIARAIVRAAEGLAISLSQPEKAQTMTGIGIEGEVDGSPVRIGSPTLFASHALSDSFAVFVAAQRALARTVVLVESGDHLIGALAVADTLRPDAAASTAALTAARAVSILSGDAEEVVGQIARQSGIAQWRANCSPQQKLSMIAAWQQAGESVAMVGDGINDAPALAAADVGISFSSGTDIAQQAADVVIIRHGLEGLVRFFALSEATVRTVRQNLFWAFAYNVLAIPLAAGLLYPAFGWTLSPMIAALAMSLSSVCVVANALRLRDMRLTSTAGLLEKQQLA